MNNNNHHQYHYYIHLTWVLICFIFCSFISFHLRFSCMHWDVSCKVHPSIRKHHWETIFDLLNHYYIDLYERTLTFELNRMANSAPQCTEMYIIKVGNYFRSGCEIMDHGGYAYTYMYAYITLCSYSPYIYI